MKHFTVPYQHPIKTILILIHRTSPHFHLQPTAIADQRYQSDSEYRKFFTLHNQLPNSSINDFFSLYSQTWTAVRPEAYYPIANLVLIPFATPNYHHLQDPND